MGLSLTGSGARRRKLQHGVLEECQSHPHQPPALLDRGGSPVTVPVRLPLLVNPFLSSTKPHLRVTHVSRGRESVALGSCDACVVAHVTTQCCVPTSLGLSTEGGTA